MSADFGFNSGKFLTGSIDFQNEGYRGFIATSATVIESIGFGAVGTTSSLAPTMELAAGTHIPVKINGMKATGAVILFK